MKLPQTTWIKNAIEYLNIILKNTMYRTYYIFTFKTHENKYYYCYAHIVKILNNFYIPDMFYL